jgi:hypothetical protein
VEEEGSLATNRLHLCKPTFLLKVIHFSLSFKMLIYVEGYFHWNTWSVSLFLHERFPNLLLRKRQMFHSGNKAWRLETGCTIFGS